ncbi:MAG: hypothetical protein GQ564_01795 [Bacteroidales bacterium]|nr:hypothetical protein [Bacteroidales bacterium]
MKYLLISTICLSAFYITYRLVFRKETNFRQLRVYLLLSILISGLIPFSKFSINIDLNPNESQEINSSTIAPENNEIILQDFVNGEFAIVEDQKSNFQNINWLALLMKVYHIVSSAMILRILIQILFLFYKYFKSDKIINGKHILIYNHGFKNSFSFFNWIFINKDKSSDEDLQKIIEHENIHVTQYHSIDLLLVELLTAVMWFNPFVWMMKNSVQLVHEYLADEGVLKNGVDKVNYQALLINLVTEEKLISISSSFNQSLIKKRMIMMNKNKIKKGFRLKLLALLPVAAFLFFGVACVKGQETEKKDSEKEVPKYHDGVTAIALTKMNVLYVGADNPVKIAVSGFECSEISSSITNGSIRKVGVNGDYIINPKRVGTSLVSVKANGIVVQKTEFRVKGIPDPVAMVAGKKGGEIKKNVMLEQKEVIAYMQNFDFDLNFEVVGFNLSTTDDKGYTIESKSNSNKITEKQIEILKNAPIGNRINFEDIKAIGPDGSIRKIPSIVFKLI